MKKYLLRMRWGLSLARLAGFVSSVLGAVVLLGWYLHEPALIQVSPAFVPMQYNTALGFALSGLALLGLVWSRPRFAVVTAIIVLLIGVLTLIEYSLGVDLRIDQLFMEHYIDLKTSNPGRMAPNTALCFSLTGLAVLLTALFRNSVRTPSWTATLGALIISLGITALAGYLIGVEDAYGWGQMTRMAIHTAAGFITLGAGFVALAWSGTMRTSPGESLPRWAPQVITITGLTVTFALWQALSAQEQRMVSEMGASAANFSDEGLLVFGVLLTLTLAFKAHALARSGRTSRGSGRIYAHYVVIVLGALLAASLYSLLATSFKASVKQRYDAAVLSHVSAIEYGIDAYLETLYHIRSGFDASPVLNREEFRTLVSRSLKRNPGIVALGWAPWVPGSGRDALEAAAREEISPDFVIGDEVSPAGMTAASRRDVYFPIYYIEPMEPFLPVLGVDMAFRPENLAVQMKAVSTDAPVVSMRLRPYLLEDDAYAVFVALPVYRKDTPQATAEERQAALRGFALMILEIGPMVEAILDKNAMPSGLTLTFEDATAGNKKDFMYRHVPRELDSDSGKQPYPDDGLSSTATLAFADHEWLVTTRAASSKVYPGWQAENLWLPLGVLLLSLGLAWFLYRSAQREQERARMLAYQAALLDSIPNPIFVKNVDAVFTACNKAYEQAFGIERSDFIGKTALDLDFLPADKRREYQDDDIRLLREGGYSQDETEMVYADGRLHKSMYWRTTFELADGVPGGMIGGLFDVTELKSLQNDLEQARDAANAANQAKSAFLANMSHELRTPMNAILGYSEMLMEEAEDLGQDDFIPDLKKINQAGTHLLALINDVLDLAKVESGKIEAFPEDIDVNNLIDEVSSTAHPLLEKNSNTLSVKRDEQLGTVHQDLTKLRQTLLNLLSNAAKFTHEGTIILHVTRTTEPSGEDWLALAVTDTGIGIAQDKIDHIFEEFTQADGSTTRDYGGTGLGLAISQRFCRLLGGDLSAQSELGKGSTFTIRIPAVLPGSKSQQQSATVSPGSADPDHGALPERAAGSTILVIDDDPEASEIIERFLVKDGYTVVTAASGEQGLRLAHELQPAAITLDVMMPDMDGWSVLRALKADPVLGKIPVIMLTMIDDRTRGYSLGAVDYLTKPVDRELLHKALSRYYCAEDICPVLLVEDDIETRDMMARTLEKAGWTVSGVGNGKEALDIMAALQPKLILLDLMMPVMDGFDFLAAMRAHPEWQHIPVIVITAKDLTGDDRIRLAGRVEQVLEKNAYTREQLLERVSEAVAVCNTTQAGTNTAGNNDE